MGEKQVPPSKELAVIICVAFLLFASFNYFAFTKDDFGFFGVWPVLLPAMIGIYAFLYTNKKTSKYKDAEKYYLSKRQSVMSKYPRDNNNYLERYK